MRAPTTIPDRRRLEQVLENDRGAARKAAFDDTVFDGGRRLVLRSPNGHYWSIGVSDAGALTATDIGTTAP